MEQNSPCSDPGASNDISDVSLVINTESLFDLSPVMAVMEYPEVIKAESLFDPIPVMAVKKEDLEMEPCDALVKEEREYHLLEPAVHPLEEITIEENGCKWELGSDEEDDSDTGSNPANYTTKDSEQTGEMSDHGMLDPGSSNSGQSHNPVLKSAKMAEHGRFKCSICDKSYVHKSDLTVHMRIHSGLNLHKCDICSKDFVKRSILLRHKMTHTGHDALTEYRLKQSLIKPHKCKICGKCFKREYFLTKHILVHSESNLLNCDKCGLTFTTRTSVDKHKLKIHTGPKPHKCEVCGKSFRLPSYLTNHMMNHPERKPHKCDVCSKTFSKPYHLTKHKLIHSDH